MSEERATYGEEHPDITDDNWKLAELKRLLVDKEKELQRARELEAFCAAMRKALEQVDRNLRDPEQQVPGTTATFVNLLSTEYIAEALSTDAGKAMLETLDAKEQRIKELEEQRGILAGLLKQAVANYTRHTPGCDGPGFACGCGFDWWRKRVRGATDA